MPVREKDESATESLQPAESSPPCYVIVDDQGKPLPVETFRIHGVEYRRMVISAPERGRTQSTNRKK
jgi:hypothetical protein